MIERLCYDCKHIEVSYEADYSERTPGEGMQLKCWKGHWALEASNRSAPAETMSRTNLRRCLVMASECQDFEAAEHG